ncbi:hypothetical protein RQP46_005320 [Phenoliferia psychrophenolica]
MPVFYYNPHSDTCDRRDKQQKKAGAALDERRQKRSEEERAREVEDAKNAQLVERRKKVAREQEEQVRAAKLMEREVDKERSKTTRLEAELEKLSTTNSKLFRTLATAQDSLSQLPSTPFPISTPRPAEASALSSQSFKLESAEKTLEELRVSTAEIRAEIPTLEEALAKSSRGNRVVGLERTRLKEDIKVLMTKIEAAEEDARRRTEAAKVAETRAREKAQIAEANERSQEELERKSKEVDMRMNEIEMLRRQVEDDEGVQEELRCRRLLLACRVHVNKKRALALAGPPRAPVSSTYATCGSGSGSTTSLADAEEIHDLENRLRKLVDEKENVKSKARLPSSPVDPSLRRARTVTHLVATVANLNKGVADLREENTMLLLRLVGVK